MYRKILFAVEDDAALPAVVPAVAAFARSSLARVHVVHVERGDPASSGSASRQLVDAVIGCLRPEGVEADGEVLLVERNDQLAPAIAEVAKKAGVDLVVLGSRGRSDLVGLVLGSVSHRVSALLDAPVLIVRAGQTFAQPRRILVAVDGSAASDEAVTEAGELALTFDAEVMVLHVQHLVTVQGTALVESEAEAWAVVDEALEELKAKGVKVWGEAHIGYQVGLAVVSAAERYGADLVVLGSRRPSEMSGLLLGSVGHHLIHHLHRPVLFARRVLAEETVA